MKGRVGNLIAAWLLLGWVLPSGAEVVFDGATGGPVGVLAGDITITQGDGLVTPGNDALLHSFELFNVLAGESVTFSHITPTINNILLRVTGEQPSLLDGTLASDANLWLLNPNGVVQGEQATLDVAGTFRFNELNGDGAALILNDGSLFSVDTNLNTLAVARPAAFGFGADAALGVVADPSIGTVVSAIPQGDGQLFSISGGSTSGANLFHSFDQFNVFEGDTARFSAPEGSLTPFAHVISRVTGANQSFLTGTVQTLGTGLEGASFWLVNPAGLFVGNGVQFDVGRGLHLGVADGINLSNGFGQPFLTFSSQMSNTDIFAGTPQNFFFAGPSLNALVVNELEFNQQGRIGNSVTDYVSLVGPNLDITNSSLQLEATLGQPTSLAAAAFRGLVRIDDSAVRSTAVGDANAGAVFLSGARLLANGTSIELITTAGNTDVAPTQIFASFGESVSLVDTTLRASTSGVGSSGAIGIGAPHFNMDGGVIEVRSTGVGLVDQVFINSMELAGVDTGASIRLTGGARIRIDTLDALSQAGGTTGFNNNIALVSTGDVELEGLPDQPIQLRAESGAQSGPNGSILVRGDNVSANHLTILANNEDTLGSGLTAPPAEAFAPGSTAIFVVSQRNLDLMNTDLSIATSGRINAGDLSLQGQEITLDGVRLTSSSEGEGSAGTMLIGNSGPPMISPDGSFILRSTTSLNIANSEISATAGNSGDSGDVFVESVGTILIDNVRIGVSSRAEDDGGAAGNIFVSGGDGVAVRNQSAITATTASGIPGFIGITGRNLVLADTRVTTDSMSSISGSPDFASIGINTPGGSLELTNSTVSASVSGAGNSSGINLASLEIKLVDSAVSASTSGAGSAGQIGVFAFNPGGVISNGILVAPNSVGAGVGAVDIVNSRITSDTRDGFAGQIAINSDRVHVTGPKSLLSTNSVGSAAAGTLSLFGSAVTIDDGAVVQSTAIGTGNSNTINISAHALAIGDLASGHRTSISTNSASSQGGDIVARSFGVTELINADLVASAGAQGSGGNVQVDLNGGGLISASSTLLAQAENGSGGAISINPVAGALVFIDGQSVLSADSATGTSGSVDVDSPDTGIVSALSQQEASLAPEARLNQDVCSATTRATGASSLYVRETGNQDRFAAGYLGSTGRSQSAHGGCQ